jgi:hypothetical protein
VYVCTLALPGGGPGRRRGRVRIALYVYRITTYVVIAYKHLGAPLTQSYEPLGFYRHGTLSGRALG